MGALPPAPRHLPRWTNGMRGKATARGTPSTLMGWAQPPRGEGVPPLRPWFCEGKEQGQDALATNHATHPVKVVGVEGCVPRTIFMEVHVSLS